MHMTHDPHLPTLEQVMDGFNRDPREFVDTPLGRMERWCAETMLIGTTKGMLNVYDTIRSDAASQAARADAEQAREALITHVCDQITELSRRFDDLEARLNEAEDKRRSDAQAAREAEAEDPLDLPPDLAEYQAAEPPAPIGDEAPAPGGELHAVAAKEPDPDLPSVVGDDDDNIGDLPEELEDPPDPVPEPSGSVHPQPTAISLNKE
jgi:hypothetical protein